FQLGGAVSWQEAILFDLKASAQNFNPAILLPELPGNLSFNALVKGKLAGESLQVNADINQLQGRLRGQPVSANGKLALANEQLSVDSLRVIVGRNKLNIDGTLGQEQARLNASIDAPALDALWPGLSGQIKGEGQLQGAWLNPAITFQATGKRLHFAEHSVEQLAVNVDYQPETNKSSQLKLSASNIKSGANQLSKLQIDGLGRPEQHRFTIDLSSNYGELSSALTGRLKGNSWEGDFSKLDVQSNDAGRWQLSNNLVVRMTQSAKGIDAKLAQTCLHQQAAMLCLNGSYLSNNDLQFQLKANDLPLSLLQAYAPEGMHITGIINADADIQQQKGLLTGNYRLDLPATSIAFAADKQPTTVHLGASSLSGALQGSKISADINLALAAQDYLRGQLQVDTGNTQALSGQIKASIADLSLLNSFLPQLTGLKGKFNADLALLGTTAAPTANGAITFTQGAADLNGLGLELRDINLQARATGTIAEEIQITGSAKSGQGIVNLSGVAKLPGTVELLLTGKDFEVAKLPEAQIAISPELKLLFADNRGKVTGIIKVPKAIMQIQQLPEQAVTVSSDEVIIGAEKTIENTATAPSIDADIEIELGKQVSFTGQGLQTNLSGKLKIMKTAEKLAMYGNVDMDKGHYTSYGQDLTVRKGRFVFNGPVDQPWLDVEAIRVSKSKKVTAILSVTGPLKSPKTRLSSEPALPETDVLAYLVTGNPLNQASTSESNMIASAAVSLGAGRVSWLADQLGIENLEVKEGKTLEDTLVAVGQYLTPDFYVGTKVGLFNKQAVLVLKHKLTNTINVETETGTSQRIKLNYEFERD
ncbi:MAG: translocation/assembly module TamB domain-containing protein, partial [Methylococcales bacterium]|nr:translocation/assembly module TamB domain-containing protein [Methylococcales bacterium]